VACYDLYSSDVPLLWRSLHVSTVYSERVRASSTLTVRSSLVPFSLGVLSNDLVYLIGRLAALNLLT